MNDGLAGRVAGARTFIHIDLHKDQLTFCAVDADGAEVGVGRLPTKCRNRIVEWIKGWPRPVWVSIEAVGFYRWLWVLLEPHADRLLLADAARLRRMGERDVKTDFRDARHGARLLRLGVLPCNHALGEPLYALRQQLRHRHDLARRLASLKNSLRRLCLRANLPGPRALSGARAVAYAHAYGTRLHAMDQQRWLDLTDQILLLERQVDACERALTRHVAALPGIHEHLRRSMTAPGIGLLVAATVFTETGGLERFQEAEEIACFSGLTPRTYASAGHVRHGHISKAGPPNLRWALQQAAWVAIRTDPGVRRLYQRLARRAGSKRAAVAIARRLLIWLWAMHRHHHDWDPRRLSGPGPARERSQTQVTCVP